MPGQSSSKLVPQVLPKANIASVKLCWHFSRGFCRLGAACGFAHGTSETIKLANAYEANLSSSPGTIAPVMPMKTKLCSFFCRGECNKGSACTFAHGEHEPRSTKCHQCFHKLLRLMARHNEIVVPVTMAPVCVGRRKLDHNSLTQHVLQMHAHIFVYIYRCTVKDVY